MTQLCATQLVLLNNYFLLLCTANTHRKAAIQTTIWITFRALSQVQVYWNWNTQRFYANHPSTSWLLTRPTYIYIYIYIYIHIYTFILSPNSPKWAQVATMLKFLDHKHTHIFGRTPLYEWSARRRGRYLHNKQKRRTSMPSAGV